MPATSNCYYLHVIINLDIIKLHHNESLLSAPDLRAIFLFVPNLVTILTTIPTLKYLSAARKSARQVKGTVPWQGALTVALTAAVYCLSTLPISVFYAGRGMFDDPTGLFRFKLFRFSFFVAMINIMSNFYIYALTIKSFRESLIKTVSSITSNF